MPHRIMVFLDRVRSAHSKKKAATPFGVRLSEVPPVGAEQLQDSAGKSRFGDQGDAESDAFSDSRLVKLIEVWPALSDDLKAEILRLVSDDVDDLNDVTTDSASD